MILLAAGRSRRMGGPDKRLLVLGGETLLARAARLWHGVTGAPPVVVLREGDDAARAALAGIAARIVVNPLADEGPHTSVLTGLAALAPLLHPVIVALVDQPLLTGADAQALVAATLPDCSPDRSTLPFYKGARGNPVVLAPALATRALATRTPPRRLLDGEPALVHRWEAPNDHFTRDCDTPEDWATLRAAQEIAP